MESYGPSGRYARQPRRRHRHVCSRLLRFNVGFKFQLSVIIQGFPLPSSLLLPASPSFISSAHHIRGKPCLPPSFPILQFIFFPHSHSIKLFSYAYMCSVVFSSSTCTLPPTLISITASDHCLCPRARPCSLHLPPLSPPISTQIYNLPPWFFFPIRCMFRSGDIISLSCNVSFN